MYKVEMFYFSSLSNNSYKIGKTYCTKGEVKVWQSSLARRVEELSIPIASKYLIQIEGFFWDSRHPDIHNLHKVIGDAIKVGLKVDDKKFFFRDKDINLGYLDEKLVIGIEPILE